MTTETGTPWRHAAPDRLGTRRDDLSRSSQGAAVISHQSLPEAVRLTLRRRILNNELPAGERLIEANLAAEFGVSRTTLRAALMELKNDRLVEFSPRRGCSVARMSRSEVEDACFARYLLEAGAACEDRAVIDERLLASLDLELGAMAEAAKAGDLAAIVECDTRMHGLLVEAGGRARLAELWHELDGQMGALMRSSLEFQESDLSQVVERHRVLIQAVRSREKDVIAAAIKDHYLNPLSVHDHDDRS
jgi:GntR family transcriptional regulator, rspAB operon transcriptional repressor